MNDNNKIMSAIDSIAANVLLPPETTYLGADGLLYCLKCNGKRQTRVTFLGKERIMPCACKCVIERVENEKRHEKAVEQGRLIQVLRQEAFPDANMRNWTFAADDGSNPNVSRIARKYADNFNSFKEKGIGLLLHGGVGTGKTFIAVCIGNALIDKGVPVLMTNFPRIANTVQGLTSSRQEYYDSFRTYPLLILDDFVAERKTEFMQEIVFNVINARCDSGLPMIVTSNITTDVLKNPTDQTNERIFSRLLGCCHPIKVEGTDRRKQQFRNDFENTKKMLGL